MGQSKKLWPQVGDLLIEKVLTKGLSHPEVLEGFYPAFLVLLRVFGDILVKMNHSAGVQNEKIMKNRTCVLASEFSSAHPGVFHQLLLK